MMTPLFRLLSMLVFTLFFGGCGGTSPENTGGTVSLWVTRDFAGEELFSGELQAEAGQSVMALLKAHLGVETEYGGGFVNSIGGLASGYTAVSGAKQEKLDWFYYMNGIASGVGAVSYFPRHRDVIWWDYHSWGNMPFTPAVIGAFPQPFLNGYQEHNPKTVILTGDGCSELGELLAGHFRKIGVAEVEVLPYEEKLAASRAGITIVIAPWAGLSESNFWKGMQINRDKTGWFAELSPESFHSLNVYGKRQASYDGNAGAILATGTGLGDPTPLWLLTALDAEDLRQVVEILLSRPEQLFRKFGALVVDGEVIGLPVP
jgi:hypothetical protein